MNPGSPGSHSNDSIQDDDFLDSVSHMSDAKRRRVVEAGGMAGCKSSCAVVWHIGRVRSLIHNVDSITQQATQDFPRQGTFCRTTPLMNKIRYKKNRLV
jgi:hypothetical protein